jgi:hypothetical protein
MSYQVSLSKIDFSRAGYDGVCGCDDEPEEERDVS